MKIPLTSHRTTRYKHQTASRGCHIPGRFRVEAVFHRPTRYEFTIQRAGDVTSHAYQVKEFYLAEAQGRRGSENKSNNER